MPTYQGQDLNELPPADNIANMNVVRNPTWTKDGGRKFRVQNVHGKLSTDAYWTRKSARIAMKKGQCTFE